MSFTESNLSPGGFGPGDTEWIHLIIGEWQIIADIAQSDLVVWFPTDYVVADGSGPDSVSGPSASSGFSAIAHVRPSNVHTLFHHDIVDHTMDDNICDEARKSWHTQKIVHHVMEAGPSMRPGVKVTFVPIVRNSRTIALLSMHTIPTGVRASSKSE